MLSFLKKNNIKGIFCIITAALFFSLMSVFIKLSLANHNVIEIIFLRSLFSILVLTFFINPKALKIKKPNLKLHALRTILGLSAMFSTFTALKYIPLSHLTIISFSKIFFLIPLAVILFKEPISRKSFFYVFLGFIGVVVIVGYEIDSLIKYKYYLFAILGAFLIALVKLLIKKLSRYELSTTIQFWFALFCFSFMLFPYFYFASIPNYNSILNIIFVTIFGLLAQYFTIEGLRLSKSTIVMPFDFFRIIFATFLGIFIFSEKITVSILIGSIIIIYSGLKLVKLFNHR